MNLIARFVYPIVLWVVVASVALQPAVALDSGTESNFILAKVAPRLTQSPAQGMLLLARRHLPDTNFRRTLVLLLSHGEDGTLGLVVNRPTRVTLSEAIPQIEGVKERERLLYWGGPVAQRQVLYLLRHDHALDLSAQVVDDIYFGTHPKLLARLFQEGKDAGDLRVFAGLASWGSGQLAAELSRGDWHLLRGDAKTVFNANAESLWEILIDRKDPKGLLSHGGAVHSEEFALLVQ